MNCRVCDTELEQKYGRCPYCGYSNRAVLTVSSDDSNDYRRILLSRIGAFSLKAYKYKWNEQKHSFETLDTVELFDKNLTGTDYCQDVKVSDVEIAQIGIGEAKKLEIEYKYDGILKKAAFEAVPIRSDKPWKIGLKIDEHLRLSVFIGDLDSKVSGQNKYVEVSGIELNFAAN